jgi:hypothetical protein
MRKLLLLSLLLVTTPASIGAPPIEESIAPPPGLSILESRPVEAAPIPLSVVQTPVTFMTADAAEVLPIEDGVVIFAEGLRAGTQYGMALTVSEQPVEFIEVHPKANPFPPTVQTPIRPNVFLIKGKLGEVFYVSIRAHGEPPTWETVTITTDGTEPDEPPPVDPGDGEIEKLSRARADALNDAPTRTALKAAITAAVGLIEQRCASGDCPPVDQATAIVVDAIEATLGKRDGPSEFVEWKAAWRTPISDAIKARAVTTTAGYLTLMKEAAQGL